MRATRDFRTLVVMDRRGFVRRMLAVTAGGSALASSRAWANSARRVLVPPPACTLEEVRAAFPCLAPGTAIDRWTVVEVLDPAQGGIPVVMATAAGERFRVDVLRRDDEQLGVANTGALSLYLVNQGKGATRTNEEHGLGAMALAQALGDGALPGLLTLRERNRRFPRN